MKFEDLDRHIPYALWGKEKSLEMKPYKGITLAMPGRHALDTDPPGGDFVVMVTDKAVGWTRHQFTHSDLFADIELRYRKQPEAAAKILDDYYQIITGSDPDFLANAWSRPVFQPIDGVIGPMLFLYAVQCLAVAEHRRYHKHEKRVGGRYLPFRFAAGIAEGLWTSTDAASMERKGRPGVEILEKANGTPLTTQTLFGELND